ncbi:MAG: hypothetical protein QOD99_344 [Chthoniobacter sp.]|jgi:hypothetical protein|nr:hypothetical protein [Chthoniobacter sp.]
MNTKLSSVIEHLEVRIAPATLLNPTTVTFQDVDGDDVTVKLSKPLFTDAAATDGILHFTTGTVNGDNSAAQQLERIDVSAVPAATTAGLKITVSAKRSATHGGDGFANVGEVKALLRDLNSVSIAGDLGRITVGDGVSATSALKSLTVQSLGGFGTSTGAPDLESDCDGKLEKLSVKGDIRDAFIKVIDSGAGGNANIAKVTVGGSLFGGAGAQSGSIFSDNDIGTVKIGGSLEGGDGDHSGGIFAEGGQIASITVTGTLHGRVGTNSGAIQAGTITSAKVLGNIIGGSDEDSGEIKAQDSLGKAFVGGSIFGGSGGSSGGVASDGSMGSVTVKGDIHGGGAGDSGSIDSDGTLGSVTIGGSIYAGSVLVIAVTAEETIGKIKIGGGVFGTSAAPIQISALASVDNELAIASLNIKGGVQFLNIFGGTDENPSNAAAQLGKITIGGDFIASNIAAGIDPVDGNFGNGDDTAINLDAGASKIASVVIKGAARGTVGGTDHFAIIAREVGSVKIGSVTAPLTAGASNDLVGIPLGATGDFTVLEIA